MFKIGLEIIGAINLKTIEVIKNQARNEITFHSS
jgi:hypothetical protein